MGWIFFLVLYKIRSLCENIREKKGHLLLGKRKVALERSSERSRESSNGSSNIQRHFNWCLTCWTSGILKIFLYFGSVFEVQCKVECVRWSMCPNSEYGSIGTTIIGKTHSSSNYDWLTCIADIVRAHV